MDMRTHKRLNDLERELAALKERLAKLEEERKPEPKREYKKQANG